MNNRALAEELVHEYLSKKSVQNNLELIYLYSNFTCNEHCRYCWIDESNVNHSFYLTRQFVERFIYDAIRLGTKRVKISGGEPFLNDELIDIINYLISLDLLVDVETNGTLLEGTVLNNLEYKSGHLYFKISLDSPNPSVQDEIVGNDHAFERTIDGIKHLKERGIPFDVVTVVSKYNYNDVEQLIDYVKTIGASNHRIILNLQPIGHGKTNQEINIGTYEINQLLEIIYKKEGMRVDFGSLHSTLPPAFVPIQHLKLEFCSWGTGMCGIMPNGDVSICAPAFETMGIVCGNLYKKSLREIWESSSLFNKLRDIQNLEGVCGICLFKEACRGMCRIFAKAKYGSFNSPYPFCQELYEDGFFPTYYLQEGTEK